MSAEYATFGLAPAMRAGGVLANGAYQVHRDFVDFIVDGRPLLFQLSDLDAVSPLASDVPPSIFTAQVRSLLLEADAPLTRGRYVIYGCPECADLACGAVTAVIERDGEDYVWRDFAWQTEEEADLKLNGYTGIGPFRFHGPEYRSALQSLLRESAAEPSARRRVLLIGARVAVLAKLAAALRAIGIGADIAHDATGVSAEELRTYGVVAFGRAVGEADRGAVRLAFQRAGSRSRTSTGSPRSFPSSSPRSSTPSTAARRNSAASPVSSPPEGRRASRSPPPAGWSSPPTASTGCTAPTPTASSTGSSLRASTASAWTRSP